MSMCLFLPEELAQFLDNAKKLFFILSKWNEDLKGIQKFIKYVSSCT